MKNKILLLVTVAAIGVLFAIYMVPNIQQRNGLDQLASALDALKRDLPENEIAWFIAKDSSDGPPGVYYKTQFALAPRIIMRPQKIADVPPGQRLIVVDDQAMSGHELTISDSLAKGGSFFVNRGDFTITLLTKK